MGLEREDKIINGKMKLTVATIFLIDDNWKVFKPADGGNITEELFLMVMRNNWWRSSGI